LDSVPIFSALARLLRMQLVITTCWQGRLAVAFSTMASSPVSIEQLAIRTLLQLSMSMPSRFSRILLWMRMPSMVTFSQAR